MTTTRTAPSARHAAADAPAHAATGGDAASRILDTLIAAAPELLRQRTLLAAADWRKATPDQIARLLARLDEADARMPAWLARALVVAGHAVAAETVPAATAELRALAALNALATDAPLPDVLRQAIDGHEFRAALEPDIAAAMTERLLACREPALACQVALAQWPHGSEALRLVRKALPAALATLPDLRVRLAGFSATQLLGEALTTAFATVGRRAEITKADFGAVFAALLEVPAEPGEAMILLLDQHSVFATDWRKDLAQTREDVDARIAALADAIAAYAARGAAPLFINTLPAVDVPALGHIDRIHQAGAAAIAERVNRQLAELADTHPSVQLVDTDVALAAIAPHRRSDAKLWFYGRMAYSDEATRALASAFALAWQSRRRAPVKVVALDFDNTLWGGVFGDDGIDRLACGDDFPGNAYKAMQQECLRLKAQGLLLVGLSKNNPDALEVFGRHPGMTLAVDDFAATAVDWQPKPDNIRRLAKELNLGLDSFLFLDDSPHEREAMRRMCPQVQVPEMPADPALRPSWLRALRSTWPLRLTAEDSGRAAMYVADRKSKELRQTAASYDDYLRALGQSLNIETLSPRTLPRVAQLHERTNQFNLTTRRFTEPELAALMTDTAGAVVVLGSVADRFGEHGIVIAAVATLDGRTARIESLLMSCRVIARQVETAFLDALVAHLAGRGITRIEGVFRPTAKNAMVRTFYPTHGFTAQAADHDDQAWLLDLAMSAPPHTPHVAVQWRQS